MLNNLITRFSSDWRFARYDGDASQTDFDDRSWRTLSVPHDWSIEQSYDKEHGDPATAYLTGGVGWYRRAFDTPSQDDCVVYLVFDGVYNNARFWVNGHLVGDHPYGYSPFYFDVTSHLRPKGYRNVLAVRVDRTRYVDSRWYTGSGIYRNVDMVVKDTLHFPVWSTFVTTKRDGTRARVHAAIRVKNGGAATRAFRLETAIVDAEGAIVTEGSRAVSLEGDGEQELLTELVVEHPRIWDVDDPYLYTLVSRVVENDNEVDLQTTRFGVREIRFTTDSGFFLNGRAVKIKGVCLHHDAGLVGAAVPKDVWRRRLRLLKEGGCNAIRSAHNPASNEMLDVCDEIGLLVQDEFFDEWDYSKDKRLNRHDQHDDYLSRGYNRLFRKWGEQDLKNTILSHRNHPSIFQWSIGNEIEWTYPRLVEATGFFDPSATGNYFWSQPPHTAPEIRDRLATLERETHDVAETAAQLSRWTRELDTSRPIVANCIFPSASLESGLTGALDIVGFSYRHVMYDYVRENYPDVVCMGTENVGQWHEWKAALERPAVAGIFIWTGADYLGEAASREWPHKALSCGLLDFAGFEKPSYRMFQTLWLSAPQTFLYTQRMTNSRFTVDSAGGVVEKEPGSWQRLLWEWPDVNRHWNYESGETTIVEVYSNCDEVELFLNEESLGKRRLADFDDHIYKWAVPFAEGELTARGSSADPVPLGAGNDTLVTAGEPTRVILHADRTEMVANGTDCAHVVAQLVDQNGIPVRHREAEVAFRYDGPCVNRGVDNGWPQSVQPHASNAVTTHNGRALTIVQAVAEPGAVTVSVEAEGLVSESVAITSLVDAT